jgi:hypothetical protein
MVMAAGNSDPPTTQPSPTSTIYSPETRKPSDAMPTNGPKELVDVEKQDPREKDRAGEGTDVGGDDEVVRAENDKTDEDRFTVRWEGPDDLGDPLNTPGWKKW